MKDHQDFERKLLREIATQLNDPDGTLRKHRRTQRITFGFGMTGLIISFFLAMNNLSSAFVAALIAGFSGMLGGIGLSLKNTQRQWPIIRKYIDLEAIKRRLAELNR